MNPKNKIIKNRKEDHLSICINKDITFKKTNGFKKYEFLHNALPKINLKDINTNTEF